jgi:branched-chain amino acid transport system substrate-binding protein
VALERAGRDLTVDKFIAASEQIKGHENLFGSPPMTFGPNRRLGTTAFVLTRITQGKFKRVTGTLGE